MEPGGFENTAELMEFFRANESEITERFNGLVAIERPRNPIRLRNCGYIAVSELIFETGRYATSCQIYRLADVLICK